IAQTLLEGPSRRWQDEDGLGLRHASAHLSRPLPIDFENHVVAFGDLRFDRLTRGAVVIVEYARMLEKLATRDQALELRHWDEVILATGDLRGPFVTCGVRDRDVQLGHTFEQCFDQRGLAGPGRGGDNKQLAASRDRAVSDATPSGGGRWRNGILIHSKKKSAGLARAQANQGRNLQCYRRGREGRACAYQGAIVRSLMLFERGPELLH